MQGGERKGAGMSRFMCQHCKTRFYSAGGSSDILCDLCSKCGSPLLEAPDLNESLGMGTITLRASDADVAASVAHESVADRLGHVIARREVARAQARLDGERWADDGGSFAVDAPVLTPG
jgi:hypothetical protein